MHSLICATLAVQKHLFDSAIYLALLEMDKVYTFMDAIFSHVAGMICAIVPGLMLCTDTGFMCDLCLKPSVYDIDVSGCCIIKNVQKGKPLFKASGINFAMQAGPVCNPLATFNTDPECEDQFSMICDPIYNRQVNFFLYLPHITQVLSIKYRKCRSWN